MLRFNRVKKFKVKKKKNYPDLNPRFYRQDKAVLKISWMLGRTSIMWSRRLETYSFKIRIFAISAQLVHDRN